MEIEAGATQRKNQVCFQSLWWSQDRASLDAEHNRGGNERGVGGDGGTGSWAGGYTTRVPQFILVWLAPTGQSGQNMVESRRWVGGGGLGGGVQRERQRLIINHMTLWIISSSDAADQAWPLVYFSLLLQDYLQGDSTKAYNSFGWKPKVTFQVRCDYFY